MAHAGDALDPARYATVSEVERPVAAAPAAVVAVLHAPARFPEWLTLHISWRDGPPGPAAPGLVFAEQIALMGIPADLTWTVTAAGADTVALAGAGPMGLEFSVAPAPGPGDTVHDDVTVVRCRAGFAGDPVSGPIGASLTRAVEEALADSLDRLTSLVSDDPRDARRGSARPGATVRHRATGTELDPRTPVVVGVGQVVRRDAGAADDPAAAPDPATLAAHALRVAGEDSGTGDRLLRAADAVYAVASATWTYRDSAALVAAAVGADRAETVMSSPFGGDAGQLLVNAAAAAIHEGRAEVVLVTGAEAGASLAAAQRRGRTPDWPEQAADVAPDRVLGTDRPANNAAETAVGLGAPVYMYALLETAVAARASCCPAEHKARIAGLWSRFSAVAADNPYAWLPREHSAERLSTAAAGNRPISEPYTKLLCANLQVDLASGIILTTVAAAEAAGVPQEKWVFPHAGASGHDEWFVSERAHLAASPAIRTLGDAVLRHAGLGVGDLTHVDLYACFPSAVQIAAKELGLPVDDPQRPLTVTGGLTFAGGPGNNYGGHGIATIVERLRAEPGGYGLATSLGWYATKHAIGVFSSRPPARPFRDLRPVIEHPPSRPVVGGYTGDAIIEAYTVPYNRAGEPQAAILSLLTPAGGRVLVRTKQEELVELLRKMSPVGRIAHVYDGTRVELNGDELHDLPEPPPPPVLVERRGPVTVITLNRPASRNAVDLATARALERAIDAFEADPDAVVAVLTGAGGTFCSGMDLKAAARGEYPITERRGPFGLTASPPAKPLIAAVEGAALAGGFELAITADLVVAARDARFGLPEPKRGLVAAAGGVARLATRIPRNVAMELALTGEPLGADRLAQAGLVNRLTEPGSALPVAIELALQIAANAPLSLRVSKRIVDAAPDWTAAEAFDRQAELATEALRSADAREGVVAFAERRAPVWRGR